MKGKVIFDTSKKKQGEKGGSSKKKQSSSQQPIPSPQLSSQQLDEAKNLGAELGVVRGVGENVKNQVVDEKEKGEKKEAEKLAEEKIKIEKEANIKFEGLLKKNEQILMQFRTVFPFDLFPDQITIDLNKITISTHEFFSTEAVTSVMIKEIKDVALSTAGFLATLTIETTTTSEPLVISKIKTQDGLKARRIIQGLIASEKENIQLTKVKTDNLPDKIEAIGRVAQI